MTEAGWEAMVRLNLTAQVFGAQAAARVMRDRGTGGSIIFLSSIDSLYAAPGGEGIYGACKAALNNIVQTMAVELGQHRIRVNALAPAVVETPLTAPWLATEAAEGPCRTKSQVGDKRGYRLLSRNALVPPVAHRVYICFSLLIKELLTVQVTSLSFAKAACGAYLVLSQ